MALRILLADPLRPSQQQWWKELFPPQLGVGVSARAGAPEHWRELLPQADVLVGYRVPLRPSDLDRAPQLRLVVQIGLHPPPFDPAMLAARGIPFRIERDPANVAVAEHTLLLMLALVRRLLTVVRLLATARDIHPHPPAPTSEESYAYNWPGVEGVGILHGRVLGLVGLGEIGIEVARRAGAFGMRILYHKRRRLSSELEARLGVEYRSLRDLLAESDIVSLHAPHTPETHHLIGPAELALMKPDALLVNTSRGGLVDEAALAAALRAGRLAGAGLDVFCQEPLPHDSELRRLGNVLLTPHVAAIRPEAVSRTFAGLIDNVARLARNEPPAPRAESDLIYVMG